MNQTGGSDALVLARSTLLDALIALRQHRESVVVIGAQVVYLHTGSAPVAVAEATKDSDVGIDLRTLGDDPLIDEAMRRAGFHQDLVHGQPGSWLSPSGIPVDLMVPDAIAGSGRRSVQAPPHDKRALRRAVGLEAAIVDNSQMTIRALAAEDDREVEARVAGPAALLVAKLHKLGERQERAPERLVDKDAYDVYRASGRRANRSIQIGTYPPTHRRARWQRDERGYQLLRRTLRHGRRCWVDHGRSSRGTRW